MSRVERSVGTERKHAADSSPRDSTFVLGPWYFVLGPSLVRRPLSVPGPSSVVLVRTKDEGRGTEDGPRTTDGPRTKAQVPRTGIVRRNGEAPRRTEYGRVLHLRIRHDDRRWLGRPDGRLAVAGRGAGGGAGVFC